MITDAAINIYSCLEDKVDIVQNSIYLAHALGVARPKVAILSATETVNPKIASTLDAAAIKNLISPIASEADILVVPDLESRNMLAKQLEYLGGAQMAGIVVGATVLIILTSRADSAQSRLASCAVASMLENFREPTEK